MQRVIYFLSHTINATPFIIRTLNRRHDLNNLISWAERKGLSSVQIAYINRLEAEEKRLFQATLHYPRLTRFLTVLYALWGILVPTPRYYPKGSGAAYRSRNSQRPIVTPSLNHQSVTAVRM